MYFSVHVGNRNVHPSKRERKPEDLESQGRQFFSAAMSRLRPNNILALLLWFGKPFPPRLSFSEPLAVHELKLHAGGLFPLLSPSWAQGLIHTSNHPCLTSPPTDWPQQKLSSLLLTALFFVPKNFYNNKPLLHILKMFIQYTQHL